MPAPSTTLVLETSVQRPLNLVKGPFMDECESQPVVLRASTDGIGIALRGEIDMAAADAVVAAFERVTDLAVDVVMVDAVDVTFLDSCGLRAILTGMRAVEHRGGSVSLTAMSAPVSRVLDVAGVSLTNPNPADDTASRMQV
jgi:anti-anti-sigma factor